MSFKQFGGLNYSAKNNIVGNLYTSSTNSGTANIIGQENSKITSQSHLDMSANSLMHIGSLYFMDGTIQSTAYANSSGTKSTFNDGIIVNNGSTLNGGTVVADGLTTDTLTVTKKISLLGTFAALNGLTVSTGNSSVLSVSNNATTIQGNLTVNGTANISNLIIKQLSVPQNLIVDGISSLAIVNASGLITAYNGLNSTVGATNLGTTRTTAITASGIITGGAGLNITSGTSSLLSATTTSLTSTGLISGSAGLKITGGTCELLETTTSKLTASGLITGGAGLKITGLSSLQITTTTAVTASGLITASAGLTSTVGATTLGTTTANSININGATLGTNTFAVNGTTSLNGLTKITEGGLTVTGGGLIVTSAFGATIAGGDLTVDGAGKIYADGGYILSRYNSSSTIPFNLLTDSISPFTPQYINFGTTSGTITIPSTIQSISTDTGALVVKGGVGIQGSIFASANFYNYDSSNKNEVTAYFDNVSIKGSLVLEKTSDFMVGDIKVQGNAIVSGNLTVDGNVNYDNLNVIGTLTTSGKTRLNDTLTVTSGGLTVSSGGLTVSSGYISLQTTTIETGTSLLINGTATLTTNTGLTTIGEGGLRSINGLNTLGTTKIVTLIVSREIAAGTDLAKLFLVDGATGNTTIGLTGMPATLNVRGEITSNKMTLSSTTLSSPTLTVAGTTSLQGTTATSLALGSNAVIGGNALAVAGTTSLQGTTATIVAATSLALGANTVIGTNALAVAGTTSLQGTTATSLALGANTVIGTNALAVAGTTSLQGTTATIVAATSLALGANTVIGTNALAVTGTTSLKGNVNIGETLTVKTIKNESFEIPLTISGDYGVKITSTTGHNIDIGSINAIYRNVNIIGGGNAQSTDKPGGLNSFASLQVQYNPAATAGQGSGGGVFIGQDLMVYGGNIYGPNPGTLNVGSASTTVTIGATTSDSVVLKSTPSGSNANAVATVGYVNTRSASTSSAATNISGGGPGQIPYQSSANTTTFSSNLTFDNSSSTLTSVYFNATSDYRIKEDVQNLNELFNVDNLRPVTYTNKNTEKRDIGFIAHEVQEEFPYLVSGKKDGEEMQSLNYIGLIGVLVKEIQDLKKRVYTLENQRKK